jgi:hypothetical protein
VEEAPLLMPVQPVVGGIEIKDDLLWRAGMGVQEQIDKHPFDRCRIMADLVIRAERRAAQFEPVERRFAGHRRAVAEPRGQLPGQDRDHRVMP